MRSPLEKGRAIGEIAGNLGDQRMRRFTAAILLALAVVPAAAANPGDELAAAVETQGRISISPQLCGTKLDRDAQNALLKRLETKHGIYDMQVRVFYVNNRIAKASAGWTAAQRQDFCAQTGPLAESFGLLK